MGIFTHVEHISNKNPPTKKLNLSFTVTWHLMGLIKRFNALSKMKKFPSFMDVLEKIRLDFQKGLKKGPFSFFPDFSPKSHLKSVHQETSSQCLTALEYTALHYTVLHYSTLHCTALHYTALNVTTLHYIALHYNIMPCTTLHYNTLSSAILYSTGRKSAWPCWLGSRAVRIQPVSWIIRSSPHSPAPLL